MISNLTQFITALSDFPKRSSYIDSNTYALAVETWLREEEGMAVEFGVLIPQQNTMIDEMNLTAADILRVEDLVNATINYDGDWAPGTYNKNVSVTHNGVDYLSKIDGNTDEPPSANWKVIIPVGQSTFLTQTFTTNQKALIALPEETPVATATVQKEIFDTGLVNGDWDVATDGNNYDIEDSAYAVTLTPSATTGDITLTLGSGAFVALDIGKKIAGNGGEAILTATDGSATVVTDFTNTNAMVSGSWTMEGLEFTANGVQVYGKSTTTAGNVTSSNVEISNGEVYNHLNIIVLNNGNRVLAFRDTADANAKFIIVNSSNTVIKTATTVGASAIDKIIKTPIVLLNNGKFAIGFTAGFKIFDEDGALSYDGSSTLYVNGYVASLILLDDNNFMAIYAYSHDGIRSQILTEAGALSGSEINIYNTTNSCFHTTASKLVGGNIAYYTQDGTALAQKYGVITQAGASVKATTTIVSVSSAYGAIAPLNNGNFLLQYVSALARDISFQIYDSSGTSVVGETDINGGAYTPSSTLETLADGRVFVLLSDNTDLAYQIITEAGSIGSKVAIHTLGSTWETFIALVKDPATKEMYGVYAPTNKLIEISGEGWFASIDQHLIAKTKNPIDTDFWTQVNTLTATETLNGQAVNYVVSPDNSITWKVVKATDGERSIARNNAGTWEYNSNATYTSTTWTTATTNTEFEALKEAMTITANQMSGTQMGACTSTDFFALNSELDLIIIPYTDTVLELPISDGASINYDANVAWERAEHKVEYEAVQKSDTVMEIESLGNFNFKIKVR